MYVSFFYCLDKRSFVLEDHKTHFPALYCLNKKIGKMANFGQKPLKNVNFSTF